MGFAPISYHETLEEAKIAVKELEKEFHKDRIFIFKDGEEYSVEVD